MLKISKMPKKNTFFVKKPGCQWVNGTDKFDALAHIVSYATFIWVITQSSALEDNSDRIQ